MPGNTKTTVYSFQENTLVFLWSILYSDCSIHITPENKVNEVSHFFLNDKFVMPYLGIEEDGEDKENSVVFSTTYLL